MAVTTPPEAILVADELPLIDDVAVTVEKTSLLALVTVVPIGMREVDTTVELAGQFVTSAEHEMTVVRLVL